MQVESFTMDSAQSWSNLLYQHDAMDFENMNSKYYMGEKPEKESEHIGMKAAEPEAELSTMDVLCPSSVWYPCYNVDADVCSGSERSLEETCIFDSTDVERLAPTALMDCIVSSPSHKTMPFTCFHSNAEKSRPISGPAVFLAVMDSPVPSERGAEGFGPSVDVADKINASDSVASRSTDRIQTSTTRPRTSSSSVRMIATCDAGRHGRAGIHGALWAGGAAALAASAAAAARNPKTCAYEGCPCPLQSNKWRIVTSATAAGQQVTAGVVGNNAS